jgi:predicted nucleic-acid-binding Zn-ribbon protein
MKYINITNKYCPIRTCASCEYTYWGGWKGNKECPKCGFAHYGAAFVYGGWINALIELFTKRSYKRRKEGW